MNFEEKRNFAIAELDRAGIWKSNYNPPINRILHALGFKLRFPFYNSFIRNTLETGIYFGVVWGLLMYFLLWSSENTPLHIMVLASLFGGAFFGVAMACYYSYTFKKYKLTPWDEMKNT